MVFKNIKIEWSVFFSISFFMLRTPEFKKKKKQVFWVSFDSARLNFYLEMKIPAQILTSLYNPISIKEYFLTLAWKRNTMLLTQSPVTSVTLKQRMFKGWENISSSACFCLLIIFHQIIS